MNRQPDPSAREAECNVDKGWIFLFIAWLLASIATLISLFLSEVMGMIPCPLCWYQRIFMYALVPVLLVGMYPPDRRAARYAIPLAALGWLTAFYHLLIYEGIVPERMQPCGTDNSCAEADLVLGGFVSVPALSIMSFTAIMVLLWLFNRRKQP